MATLTTLLAASAARADTTDVLEVQQPLPSSRDGFQAGPCTVDAPECSAATPGQFFKTAGGHPPIGFVDFTVKHTVVQRGVVEPVLQPYADRSPKDLRVDLPPGLMVNPEATADKCTGVEFRRSECKPNTRIGQVLVNAVVTVEGFNRQPVGGFFNPAVPGLTLVDLFNLEPEQGEPALFGFNTIFGNILLRTEIDWTGDFHTSFTIRGLPNLEGSGFLLTVHSTRLTTFGTAGDGTLATLPTTCFNPSQPQFSRIYSSWIRMDSYGQPTPIDRLFPFSSLPVESRLPPGLSPEGCENIPFNPSIEIAPGTPEIDAAASPTIATKVRVETPSGGGGPLAQSHVRTVEVTLPAGMGLNPAGSAGLVACDDLAFKKRVAELQNECPDASIIGHAQVVTPLLEKPLEGTIHLGVPRSNDPASGDRFRIFVEAKDHNRGVIVRLIGKIKADPRTGQLSAKFDDELSGTLTGALPSGLPQVPFESVTLRFDGARQVLTSPPTCSPATATSRIEPWARPGTHATPAASFTLESAPDGGACPRSLGERPFAPRYSVRPDSAQAGAYSPLRIRLVRAEGHQELKALDVTLPQGVIGKLAGIPYCPEGAIAAASGRTGEAEQGASSCPAASQVGTTTTEAGSGHVPLSLPGKVYLAGPYKGARLSLVAISPAVSGPFDLGNVVIRAALHIDSTTAQIRAVSDVIPDVFGGVKLSLRTIDLNLDRSQFTLNPTSCVAQAITGTLSGGGSDPANPAAFSSHLLNTPFQVRGCDGLGFQPTLTTTVAGPTKRGKFPSLSATLTPRPGDANVASVAVTLPKAFLVAQEHIGTVCTRPQLASRSCPDAAAYGEAEASSPLLEGKLAGPVYLVPGGGALPDLVLDLRGQVDIQVRGSISSVRGGIRTEFASTPDVPLSEFTLRMAGGKKGLIVNSTNICKRRKPASLSITGHNDAQLSSGKYKLKLTGCKKKKKPKKKAKPKRSRTPRRGS